MLGMILGGLAGAASTAYNAWANKRDYDYQRDLQQQIFEREDTAVSRRMADLKAAGLNPNLATGQAAQAGAVVSRSNTNDVNFGSAIDAMAAAQQIKNSRVQNKLVDTEYKLKDAEAAEKIYQVLTKMGIDATPYYDGGKFNFNVRNNGIPTSLSDDDYYHGKTEEEKRQWQRNEEQFQSKMNEVLSKINLNTAQINSITNNMSLSWSEFQLECNKFDLNLTEADYNMSLKTYEELRKQFETAATVEEKRAAIEHMINQDTHMQHSETQSWVSLILNAMNNNKQKAINTLSLLFAMSK